MATIPLSRITAARSGLARMKAERIDRERRGVEIPAWFDREIENRQNQLDAMIEPDESLEGFDAPIPLRYWVMVGMLLAAVFAAWLVQR